MTTTQPTIQDMNRVIAEFMGLKSFEDSRYGKLYPDPTNKDHGSVFGDAGLKYHSLWEWFMPAYRKFRDLKQDCELDKAYQDFLRLAEAYVILVDIKNAHSTLYNAITWYNTQCAHS